MAKWSLNSSHERGKKAEEIAKEWLQKKFNAFFSRKRLQVGWKSDGKPAIHNFDLASENGQIVAEVKSHKLTKSGKVPSGKISDAYKACFMFEKVNARKKFLILTDPRFYEIFKRYSNGKISKQIETMFLAKENVGRKTSSLKTMSLQHKKERSEKTDFEIFWSKLTSWLSNKQHIINWTVNSGEIPKNDFKIIYENWDGYVAGLIPRSHFVHGPIAQSRFTKYSISIIRQYMNCRLRN